MLISTWRPALKAWLDEKLIIDSWDLKTPEDPNFRPASDVPGKVHGFLPPLRAIRFFTEEGQPKGSAVQEIYITTRYPYTLKYDELPIQVLEAAYISICYGLFFDTQGIADIEDLEINQSELAITVEEDPAAVESPGQDFGDWMVTLKFLCQIKWDAEPEVTDINDDLDQIRYNITRINIGLYRQHLEGLPENLDWSAVIEKH